MITKFVTVFCNGINVPFPLSTDTIDSDVRLVFSDVVDEFCTIRDVALRFENWRNTDAVAYREAYVSLCLPKVLGPLVRLKTLMWNPLQVNPAMTNVEIYLHKHWLDRWVLASHWRGPLSV
jgi:hypothetical protein